MKTRTKIGGLYSKDDRHVYYYNRQIKGADYLSFEFVPSGQGDVQLARDRNSLYWNDSVVAADKFDEMLAGN